VAKVNSIKKNKVKLKSNKDANLRHDLRTHLTIIKMNLGLISVDGKTKIDVVKLNKTFKSIDKEIDKMVEILKAK